MIKILFPVCFSVFLLILGNNILGTVLVPYSLYIGTSSTLIGIIYSVLYISRSAFSAPFGYISEATGVKAILRYSFFLHPLIALAYFFSTSVSSLIFARVLHGFATAMLLPMAMAYLIEFSPKGNEGRYLCLYNTIFFAATGFGQIFGGFLYDWIGIKYTFIFVFFLSLLSLAIIIYITPIHRHHHDEFLHDLVKKIKKHLKKSSTVHDKNGLIALGCVNVIIAVLSVIFGTSFPQYALSNNISMSSIGALLAIYNLILGFAQIPLSFLLQKMNKFRLIIVSGITIPISIYCITLTSNILYLTFFILIIGISASIISFASSVFSADLGHYLGIGRTMSILTTITSAGTVFGYILLGWLPDLSSIVTTFYISIVIIVLCTMLFVAFWRHHNKSFCNII